MNRYSLTHLSDQTLLRDLAAAVARDHDNTAVVLAHLAEVDARKLYVPAAHPSLYSYCIHELHMSEDSACKRIRAARAARQFPAIFAAVAEGRLHLTAVLVLAPCLTPENVDELLAAATHKSKAEIERLIAERCPRPSLPSGAETLSLSSAQVPATEASAPGRIELSAPERITPLDPQPKVAPPATQRLALHAMIRPSAHDKLRYAQELLSHQIAPGDVGEVIERALDALIPELEKRKFAATSRPRRPGSNSEGRHVPAHVKRAVWERDGGQCTFVSEAGQRCPARTLLEFDHVHEVARGGQASVSGIRLRCRAHNQYSAERTFGVGFMHDKREGARQRQEARRAAAERTRAHARQQTEEVTRAQTIAKEKAEEVIPWLRALGIRPDDARRAAELCEAIPDAPLEQRVRRALTCFGPRTSPRGRAAGQAP